MHVIICVVDNRRTFHLVLKVKTYMYTSIMFRQMFIFFNDTDLQITININ